MNDAPFEDPDVHADAQLTQRGLDELGDLLALLVALFVMSREGERLARPSRAGHRRSSSRQPGLGEELTGPLQVVRVSLHVRVVDPRLPGL